MGEGRKKGPGGGGNPLNYKVVGNPQPANPKGNTIWVNTDVKITRHSFAVKQPENMAEGDIWFGFNKNSNVAFNALKENTIMVYPTSAKQMVSGALVDVKAKIWRDGEWVDVFGNLVLFDGEATDEAGAFTVLIADNSNYLDPPETVVAPTNGVLTPPNDGGYVVLSTTLPYDISLYTNLCVDCVLSGTFDMIGVMGVTIKDPKTVMSKRFEAESELAAYVEIKAGTYTEDSAIRIPISMIDQTAYFILMYYTGKYPTVTINKIWFE